jgi:[ribosomal protein S18]-alanine N-acetyltransferase
VEEAGTRVNIRPLGSEDVGAVMRIQGLCPEIAQWSVWDYERVARGDMAAWVATSEAREDAAGKNVAGFLVARRIASDLEVLNFAVQPAARRQGIGAALLKVALDWGRSFRAENALLEVRASNSAAIKFYEKHGFQGAGRRPNYYTAPIEDALLLIATLKAAQ